MITYTRYTNKDYQRMLTRSQEAMERSRQRHRRIRILFLLAFAALALGGVYANVFGAMPHYSDGARVGVVTKVSRKGFVKSWEAEMQVGTGGAFSSFAFSIEDATLVRRAEIAAKTRLPVELKYNQYWVKPMRLETPYVVTEITNVEKEY